MTGPRDHHRLIRERATSPWATELIETWVKRGGRYLAAAVALWELADPGRGRALGGLVDRIRRELRSALFEVVGRVEGMASFLAGSTSEDRFVVLDGTFYAMRIVSALSDGVACLGRAEALWQVIGEYGAEQLDEILREVCELDGSFPRFDPMNAEALVSSSISWSCGPSISSRRARRATG